MAADRAGRGACARRGVAGGAVILPGGPLKVFVATRPVDFRTGVDGLAALAQAQLRR